MKIAFLSITFLFFGMACLAQEPVKPVQKQEQTGTVTEQQLENITENSDDVETEDDSYRQELLQLQKDPININRATEGTFKDLHLISPMQVQSLLSYRNYLGDLLSIYELQSVPLWDLSTIERIRPYITVSSSETVFSSLSKRFTGGDHTILFRATQVLERSKGYKIDPSAGKNYYPGSQQKILLRYRYNYKNLLQYGVLGEKDAGEQFFKGAQKQGFDFYSAHLFAKNLGIIKSLAVGDFTVNMGQGLVQWMSLAFKKSPAILSVKREADVLRPYNSAGEIFFHRGAGITLAKKNWEGTLFGSYRNLDANFAIGDSSDADDDLVTSLQTSGFHRTASEAADKGVQRQLAFGGNLSYRFRDLHVGVNAVQYQFKYPLVKSAEPYNLYALSGKSPGNYSVDYSYTYRNLHFFGEAAMNNKSYKAFVNGVLISTASNVDMSLVYRNISKGYQSLYSNAFTESSTPSNEKGLFAGISIKVSDAWRLDAYADMYKFPWLRFRVNAPSAGSDYVAQVTYKPNKIFEIYTRYKSETKSINYNPDDHTLSPVVAQPKQDWRTQFAYKLNPTFTLRSRAEALWFDKRGDAPETGFLIYADVLYNPPLKPWSGNVRLQYFETDSYNSRLYAYENDVLYSYSIPVFYEKGYRYYVNINYDLTKKLTIWGRFAQYIYPGKTSVGSSLDEIAGNRKTEVKFQILYKF